IAWEADFDAFEAAEVVVQTSSELALGWPAMASGLQLDKYLKAVLDGALLVAGDVRLISFNGQAWQFEVARCGGRGPSENAEWEGPWLVTEKTSVQTRAPSAQASSAGADRGFSQVGGLRAVVD
ncbi:unnamed protein product, partial [Symbiodinium microadriaticum]